MQEVMRPWRMDAGVRPAPLLMYVATEDWYFLSHCLAMARAARAAGFEVHVTTNVTDDADAIRGEGFILHTMGSRRGRSSPLQTMRIMSTLRLVDERFATDLVGQAAVALYQRLLA
ncbi:MAG TPA: glycosyltransferase [Xanthobacteraceae bacterium]|nr:glycosyltransferase [Xanthobacteraceae bacterium]